MIAIAATSSLALLWLLFCYRKSELELLRNTILTRPDVRDNQPIGNMPGVAIRCGHDQPDEYGKLADMCNPATSQTRRPLGHLVKIQKSFKAFKTNQPKPRTLAQVLMR